MMKALLIGAAVLLAAVPRAGCNECVETSRRQALKRADVVFRGIVTGVEDPFYVAPIDPVTHQVALQPARPGEPRVVTFQVSRGWKGPITPTMKVLVYKPSTSFETYEFQQGKEYVVYALNTHSERREVVRQMAHGQTVYWIGTICRLRIRADAAKESKALGRGYPPWTCPQF